MTTTTATTTLPAVPNPHMPSPHQAEPTCGPDRKIRLAEVPGTVGESGSGRSVLPALLAHNRPPDSNSTRGRRFRRYLTGAVMTTMTATLLGVRDPHFTFPSEAGPVHAARNPADKRNAFDLNSTHDQRTEQRRFRRHTKERS